MIWDYLRKPDGSIDIQAVFEIMYGAFNLPSASDALGYLSDIEKMQPIFSKQCAAIAIYNAYEIARKP